MPEVDFDFLIFELQQSALESEYKLKQDLLKFKYGRIKSGTSDSPSRSISIPVATSKSNSKLSAVISSSSHPPTVSSTVHSTPSRVPVSLQHITHHPISSTPNTQRIHVSSAEFVPHSSGIQLNNSPSVVFSSIPSDAVCATQDSAQGLTEHSCISSGNDNDVHLVVHVPDHQSQSLHVQGCPCPSDVFPSDCHDNSSNAEPTKFGPNNSQCDISTESSTICIFSTDESSVDGQFSDVSSSCSHLCTKDPPLSHVLSPTPESVVVVCCQKDSQCITHFLSSDVVTLSSHSDSFASQFCYIVCTKKTDLSTILTVSFSSMKSVIVTLQLGFIDSDRRFLKRRRKVSI